MIRLSPLLILSLFLGCAQTQKPSPPLPSSLPTWYLKPPPNGTWLYGCGEGKSRERAIHRALANLSERIASQVNTSFYLKESSKDDGFEVTKSQKERKITIKSFPLTFSNYEVDRVTTLANGRILTLIRVKKGELSNLLSKSLAHSLEIFQKFPPTLHHQGRWKTYRRCEQQLSSLESILPLAHLYDTLNEEKRPNYVNRFKSLLQDTKKECRQIQNSLCLYWSHATPYDNAMIQTLLARGLTLSSKSTGCLYGHIQTTPHLYRSFGFFVAKNQLYLSLFDSDGMLLFGHLFHLKSLSNDSFEAAMAKNVEQFSKKLTKMEWGSQSLSSP